MAEAIRPGGLFLVGGEYQDANGKKVDAPTREEEAVMKGEIPGEAAEDAAPFNAAKATKDELIAEAKRLNLDVKRTDGADGELRVEDYRAALKAAD